LFLNSESEDLWLSATCAVSKRRATVLHSKCPSKVLVPTHDGRTEELGLACEMREVGASRAMSFRIQWNNSQ
jgi:hypothetical protein